MDNITEKLKAEEKALAEGVRKQVLTYVTAAFGLVAGLAWNEAIQAGIAALIPLSKDALAIKFIYAILVTIILVLVSQILARVTKDTSSGEKK